MNIFVQLCTQVEYLPSVVAGNCFGLIKEIVQGILGKQVEIPNYLKLLTNEQYTPNDTMHQYLDHFNMLKKAHLQSQQHQ